jgi:hypothetical protein
VQHAGVTDESHDTAQEPEINQRLPRAWFSQAENLSLASGCFSE